MVHKGEILVVIGAVFTDVDIIKLMLHDSNFDYLEFVTGVENSCNLQASYQLFYLFTLLTSNLNLHSI